MTSSDRPPLMNAVDNLTSRFGSLNVVQLDELARARLLMLDAASEGIYRIDRDGRCTFMNRAASRMLGYGIGEALGENMHELHHCPRKHTADVSSELCPIHGTASPAQLYTSNNEVFRSRNGRTFPVECSSTPILENGEYCGAVVTFRDITETRRTERSLRMKLAVNRLLDSAGSIDEALPRILQCICEELEFDCGAVWIEERQGSPLRLRGAWCSRNPGQSAYVSFINGATQALEQGLIHRVRTSRQVIWVEDLSLSQKLLCASVASRAGLRSGLAVPIRLGDQLHGVMELFRCQTAPEDRPLMETLDLIGGALARFIERRRAQNEQIRLAEILDAALDFVGIVADESGTVLSVNRAIERVLGYSREDVLGRPLRMLIPEYRRHLREHGWHEPAAPGQLRSARFRTVGPHKESRPVALEVSLGECIENGERLVTGIISDITERRAAEALLEQQAEELLRSEEALRTQTRVVQSIVASMGDGVIVADENSELLLVNPAAEHLVPAPLTSGPLMLEGDGLSGLFLPDSETPYPADELPLARAIRGESTDGAELFVRSAGRPDGFWVSQTARPLKDEDGVLHGGVVIVRDITEQKRAREALHQAKVEAESANHAKSEFLSRMSHELRTPMNAILGFAQLLDFDPLTAEQRDGVSRILKAGRHLLGLINEVLDISRIEAGRVNVEIEAVSPLEVVEAAVELVRPLMENRGISLAWPETAPSNWQIQADRQRLTQVILNLLSNAVKYNSEHGTVTVGFEESAGRRLRIRITDTGAGIPPEHLSKLFVPFERLGADRTAVEGTGLGLALAQRFMHLMGGGIGVDSTVGVGSTFWVEMPLDERPACGDVARPPEAEAREIPDASAGLGKILYIEDNPSNLTLVEAILDRVPGFQLFSAGRGDLGLETAKQQRPDLILLDLQLPDIHGIDVLRRLREQRETRKTPVVVVSADATARMRQELLSAGANGYLSKPIDVGDFLDVITAFF